MANSTAKPKKKRSWRKRISFVAVLLVLLLSVCYMFRVALFGDLLAGYIADQIAAASDAQVTIDSIDGSWFGDCTITGFSMQAHNPKQAFQALSINECSIDYDFWSLLNGFNIGDIKEISIADIDINMQKGPPPEERDNPNELPFDPNVLAKFIQDRIPQIQCNGTFNWRQKNMNASTRFNCTGNDEQFVFALSDTIVKQKQYQIGALTIDRIDRNTVRLNATQLHNDVSIKNAQVMVTPTAIDIRLPVTIAKQRQSLSYHYTKREQNVDCHLDFHWKKTPEILRNFLPGILPEQGHSRIIAGVLHSPDVFDITCMIYADELTWSLENNKQIRASVSAFIENDSERCDIEISKIDIQAPAHEIKIAEKITVSSEGQEQWRINPASIHTKSGVFHISGQLSESENDLSIEWENIDIASIAKAFFIKDLSGFSAGSLYCGGTLEKPTLQLQISSPNLTYGDRTFELDIQCTQNDEGILIEHAYASYGEHADVLVLGHWPGRINIDGWQQDLSQGAELNLNIEAKKLHLWPELHSIINYGTAQLDAQFVIKDNKASLSGTLDGKDLTLDALANHESFTLHNSNSFHFDNDVWKWKTRIEQSKDQYIAGHLESKAPGALLDIGRWNNNWDDFFKNMQGEINAKDLYFKIKGSLPRIGDINGRIAIDGRRIHTDNLKATLGYEPLLITGGIQAGYPHLIGCDVRVQGQRLLIVQSPSFRLRCDGDLRVHKDKQHPLNLTGMLDITDALYTEEFITTARHTPEVDSQFQLFSLPESFLGGAQLDIKVSAERSIRIRNSMLRADASGELRIRGSGLLPEPAGDVLIHEEKARLSLPFSTIWFNPSTITFKPTEPFDPSFHISGFTKMQGYDLRILLEGKMSDFSVNGIDIVSNPPISPEEATRLITTGVPPRNIFDTSKDIDTSGLVIGWAIVETMRKVFGQGDPDKDKFFNNIQVQIGRDVSDNGYNTIEVTAPLPHGYFLKVERDKYEDYNADVGFRKEW